MLTLYCLPDPFWSGSETDSIQCEQCSGKLTQTDPLNSFFTSEAEHCIKLFEVECITFGIGVFHVIIVTKIVPDQLDQV